MVDEQYPCAAGRQSKPGEIGREGEMDDNVVAYDSTASSNCQPIGLVSVHVTFSGDTIVLYSASHFTWSRLD